MEANQISHLSNAYDAIACEYVDHIFDELRHKPLDRELLDRLAGGVRPGGTICDLGCGPGHVGRYLHELGAKVVGVDLSPGMIKQARPLNPGIEFLEGNMLALPVPNACWAAIACFYGIVNLPPEEVAIALREMCLALEPGGSLLVAFHIGDERMEVEELWGQRVELDFYMFPTAQIVDLIDAAGLRIDEVIEREPYPEVEYPCRRAYIFASKA